MQDSNSTTPASEATVAVPDFGEVCAGNFKFYQTDACETEATEIQEAWDKEAETQTYWTQGRCWQGKDLEGLDLPDNIASIQVACTEDAVGLMGYDDEECSNDVVDEVTLKEDECNTLFGLNYQFTGFWGLEAMPEDTTDEAAKMGKNDGSCWIDNCTPYSAAGCEADTEIPMETEEDLETKEKVLEGMNQYLKMGMECHEVMEGDEPTYVGYYADASCKNGVLHYSAYNDDACQESADLDAFDYEQLECVPVAELIGLGEGESLWLTCTFSGVPTEDWDEEMPDEEMPDEDMDKDEDEDTDSDDKSDAPAEMSPEAQLAILESMSTYKDDWFQWLLWITYLSGAGWVFGQAVMVPLGGVVYTWLYIKAFLIDIWAVIFDPAWTLMKPWMMGPVRRAMVGSVLFGMATAWATVPGVGIATSFLFALWGVWDYYDYEFDWETWMPIRPDLEAMI